MLGVEGLGQAVIFATGEDDGPEARTMRRAHVLTKPFGDRLLFEAIDAVIPASGKRQ